MRLSAVLEESSRFDSTRTPLWIYPQAPSIHAVRPWVPQDALTETHIALAGEVARPVFVGTDARRPHEELVELVVAHLQPDHARHCLPTWRSVDQSRADQPNR